MSNTRRIALVTGGAKRVGRAVVKRLAANGYHVAFTYLRSSTEADGLVAEIKATGGSAIAVRADLADPAAAVDDIDSAVTAWMVDGDGPTSFDVLVNNASAWLPATLADTTLELTRKLWAVHVESPLLLCQRFADRLRSGDGGSIVNMVDLLAEKPWPQYLAYSATKSALHNITLGLARELAPRVTVNGIAPGVVEWPEGYNEGEKEKYLRRVPLGRAGSAEDVAETVSFLIRRRGYITGQIVRLDGGRSIT